MKVCPYCAEEIQDAAVVCKHCRRDLATSPATTAPQSVRKSGTSVGTGCLAVIFGFIGLAFLVAVFGPTTSEVSPTSGANTAPATPNVELDVRASFNGTQFIITNGSGTDTWTDATAEINGGIFSGGFKFRLGNMKPGQKATVGALQFAKSDGTRFNPFQQKPQQLTITTHVNGTVAVKIVGWD